MNHTDSVLPEAPVGEFVYIDTLKTATSSIFYVATLKAAGEGKRSDIDKQFAALENMSNAMGANSYSIKGHSLNDTTHTREIVIDVYLAPQKVLNTVYDSYDKNTIYITGYTQKEEAPLSFKINEQRKKLRWGTYYKYQNTPGQETKIKKSHSFFSITIKPGENKPAIFLTLIQSGSIGVIPNGSGAGISFSGPHLGILPYGYGMFLTKILQETSGE